MSLGALWQWLWRASFLRRLALAMALVHVAVLGVTLLDVGRRGLETQAALQRDAALQEARQLATAVRSPLLARDIAALGEQIDPVREHAGVRYVMVLDPSGRVLAHSDATLIGQYLIDPLSQAQLGRGGVTLPWIAQDRPTLQDIWAPVRQAAQVIGWVRIGLDPGRSGFDAWAILRGGAWYGLLAVAAGLLLAVGIAGNLGRDVGRLQRLMRRVRDGHLDERIAVDREDELGELMEGVNRTLQRLAEDEASLRQTRDALALERGRLSAVLAAMRQGVLALDRDERVAVCNQAFCDLLGLPGGPVRWQGQPLAAVLDLSALPRDTWRDAACRLDADGGTASSAATSASGGAMGGNGPVPVRRADGRLLSRDCVPIVDGDGQTQGMLWLVRDVTEEVMAQERLRWQALHDPLTRLPNRLLLGDRLPRAMARASRTGTLLAVCMLDLDGFKAVNDSLGHDIGDALLVEVAHRLRRCLRAEETVARLGGDEFVLLLEGLREPGELDLVLQRLRAAIVEPYTMPGGGSALVTPSIGVTLYPLNDSDADTLLRHADQAMYQAKQAGGNRYVLFDVALSQRAQSQQRLRERLRVAIERDELCLHFQPRVDLRRGEVVGAEVLVRWTQPDGTLWYPDRFLPDVEHDPLIEAVGEWVLRHALAQLESWQARGCAVPLAVNIAARHFQRADFVPRLVVLLRDYPAVAPSMLEIELVESAALDNLEQAAQAIEALHALGVTVAIDDFGMGYASLGYLRRLPADHVKIDRSFVQDMLADREDLEVVQAVIGLAHNFRRQVVAEGVETDLHGAVLLSLGCDEGQGYGIARPMPAADWPAWYARWNMPALWREALASMRQGEDAQALIERLRAHHEARARAA